MHLAVVGGALRLLGVRQLPVRQSGNLKFKKEKKKYRTVANDPKFAVESKNRDFCDPT